MEWQVSREMFGIVTFDPNFWPYEVTVT